MQQYLIDFEKGRKQVEKSAEGLKNKKIAHIFASDTKRTRLTAGIVAKKLKLKVNHDSRLRDINWGVYQGKSHLRAWAYYKNPKLKFEKAPPKGESWMDCQKRMLDFFKEIDKKYKGENILIVSHGDPLWLLEGWVQGLSQNQLLKQIGKKTERIENLKIIRSNPAITV